MPEVPEALSIASARKLLMGLLDRASQGEIISLFACIETASGQMAHIRSHIEDPYAMAGFLIASANDMMSEKFYEDDFVEVDVEDLDDDEDSGSEEIGDPS